ncbi:No hit [Brucella canis HSK A52141]|nr:No hit [Brucella canis HSK A52141]
MSPHPFDSCLAHLNKRREMWLVKPSVSQSIFGPKQLHIFAGNAPGAAP